MQKNRRQIDTFNDVPMAPFSYRSATTHPVFLKIKWLCCKVQACSTYRAQQTIKSVGHKQPDDVDVLEDNHSAGHSSDQVAGHWDDDQGSGVQQ